MQCQESAHTENPVITSRVKTRFAPSPTGLLHLGHIYAASYAANLAKKLSGNYLLRFEDIDFTRARPEFYTSILEDLAWLGIEHSEPPIRQSDRLQEYDDVLEKLKHLGVIYPCFCSRKDIQRELKSILNAPHGPSPHYPNTCREHSETEIQSHLVKGHSPCWRLNADLAQSLTGDLSFNDLEHGTIKVEHNIMGDTILARKDIGTSYHIAVVIDDAFQEITHITRGDDLLEATHIHRVLQELLNLPEPIYSHHQLIKDTAGNRLAKRSFSETIQSLRNNGHTARDIYSMLQL